MAYDILSFALFTLCHLEYEQPIHKNKLENSWNALHICKPLASDKAELKCIFRVRRGKPNQNTFKYFLCGGGLMHHLVHNHQPWWKRTTIHVLFFISLCPWNALFYESVSLAACCNYFWATNVCWLEIDLNTDSAPERGGDNKEVSAYGDKKGAEKCGQGERAAWACFACTGASVGKGVDRKPQCCL